MEPTHVVRACLRVGRALCRHLVEDELQEVIFTDTMMCAGPLAGGRGACFGDSGGALTVRDFDGRRVIVGVTSSSSDGGCANPWKPAVFANVQALRPWLDACLASPSTCPRAIEMTEEQMNE